MRKEKILICGGFVIFLVVCVLVFSLDQSFAQSQTPKPIILKAVSFLPLNTTSNDGFREYLDRVNKATKGELIINWVGGPEAIPALDLHEAVRKGVVDIGMLASAYYGSIMPEAESMSLSPLTPWEERKVGYHDQMVERHKKIGMMYIGRNIVAKQYYLYTNKKVNRPQELKGQKMRTAAMYTLFMKELGITPITMPSGDTYTALERGLVDGFGWPSAIVAPGWAKLIKYMIFPGFYSPNTTTCVNLTKFHSLPEHLQKLLIDIQIGFEKWMWDHFLNIEKIEIQKTKDAKVQFIEFTGDDAKWYVNLAYKVKWDDMEKRIPEITAIIRPMLEKK
jgi:TRAP-type C4-dicarboxylate transport system substrate-binding protein